MKLNRPEKRQTVLTSMAQIHCKIALLTKSDKNVKMAFVSMTKYFTLSHLINYKYFSLSSKTTLRIGK